MDASGFLPFSAQAILGVAELAALNWWTKRVTTAEALNKANLTGALILSATMMAVQFWSDLGFWLTMACSLAIWFVVSTAHARIVFRASKRLHGFDLDQDTHTKIVAVWTVSHFVIMGLLFIIVGLAVAASLRFAWSREWNSLYVYSLAVAAGVAAFPLGVGITDALTALVIRRLNAGVKPGETIVAPELDSLWIRWFEYAFSMSAAGAIFLAARDLWLDLDVGYGLILFLALHLGIVFREKLELRVRRIAAAGVLAVFTLALYRVATVVVPTVRLTDAVIAGDATTAGAMVAAGVDPNHPDGGSGMNAMTAAIFAGKPAALRAMLLAGADPNRRNRRGYNPLAQAAMEGNAEMVTMILAAGAFVEDSGSRNLSPLGIAAFKGRAEAARVLIAAGASVRGLPKKDQPLLQAANHDQAELVRLLLDAGAPIDSRNGRGATALHWAAEAGALKAASTLLDAGANPKLKDRRGLTALDYAGRAETNKDEMLALLKRGSPTKRGTP